MPQVNLPPGCRSLQMEDGKRYVAGRSGGQVSVSDDHAKAIDRLAGNGTAGLITAGFRQFGAVRKPGRWCTSCQPARLWQPWSETCPRCGAATEPEPGGNAAGPHPLKGEQS
jgi:hypothetical protein